MNLLLPAWLLWCLFALGGVMGVRWWLNHAPPAELGRTDQFFSLWSVLRYATDGSRVVLSSAHAHVSLSRLPAKGGKSEIELVLSLVVGGPAGFERFIALASLAGIPIRSVASLPNRAIVEFVPGLEADAFARLADLALRAVGLENGDRYRYRFEGKIHTERLRQDAIASTHDAALKVDSAWLAALLTRLSKALQRSPRGKDRGDGA